MKKLSKPPRWANRFLEWFCAEDLLEEIQGDLWEAHEFRQKNDGKLHADWSFVRDVFSFFKPYAFEKYSRAKQFLPMWNNYFKIAIRNILHRKGFTAINLAGLTIGITTVVLIGLYLKNEWTYDQHVADSERIYRLMNNYRDQTYANMPFTDYNNSPPEVQKRLIQQLEAYDDVESATHFVPSKTGSWDGDQYYLRIKGKEYIAKNVLYLAEGTDFEQIFPQQFLLGNAESTFSGTSKIALTEKLAKNFFGENWRLQDLIGTEVDIADEKFELTGIIESMPANTHFEFDFLVVQKEIPNWGAYTYLKVAKNADIAAVTQKLNAEIKKIYPTYNDDGLARGASAIALEDIHFSKDNLYELKTTANETYLYTFGLVAFIILLIVWTNYTNLSVAMYADRQKELGMRKVMGARSQDIGLQLLAEAVLLAFLCLPFCLLLLQHLAPHFADLMGIELSGSLFFNGFTIPFLLTLILLTGLLSGIYPAIAYGNKSMLRLFGRKMNSLTSSRFFTFKNALLTLQFVVIVGLVSMTFFIHQQMNFLQNKDLGFEKEGVVYFGLYDGEKFAKMESDLRAIPEIKSVGVNGVPGSEMYNQLTYKMKGSDEVLSDGTMQYVDFGSLQTLGIDCQPCQVLDEGKERIFVINRTAAEKLAKIKGVAPNELIGQTLISEPEYEAEDGTIGFPVVIDGIIEDFNYFSLKYETQPILMTVFQKIQYVNEVLLKIETDNWNETLSKVETVYRQTEKSRPFQPLFLEDRLNKLYQNDQRTGNLVGLLSLIALILALIGLAGVVSYIAFSRQKEIGIRKVLGASVGSILYNFNKEFLLLVGIATLIVLPTALYFSSKWLESFAFRITPQFWVVFLAGILVMFFVGFVVTWRAYQAAVKHPAQVLKTE